MASTGCISRDTVCNLLSIPFNVGFCEMNRAALSKTLASSVSFTEVLVIPSTTQLCLCTPCRFWFPAKNICRSSRERRFGQVDIPEFPAQRKSDQFVLVATVPLQTRLRLRPSRIQPQSRQRSFQRWLDDRDVVLQISHFGSSGHVGEPRSFRGKHAALSR